MKNSEKFSITILDLKMFISFKKFTQIILCFSLCILLATNYLLLSTANSSQKMVPLLKTELIPSYAPLVKKASPAVVNIYTKRVIRSNRSPFFNDPFFKQFFGDNVFQFGVPRKRVERSLGSGVIVRSEGIVVTNSHVIKNADEITVILSNRSELAAKVILADDKTDLAVLKIQTGDKGLPFLKLRDSDDLEVGDIVLAIGNPFGVGQTVTNGIVSALARAPVGISDFSFFIQTDAAINPGNSGGALITMDGKLVGVNTAIYSRSGGSQGIGFAIPSNMVARIIDNALNGAKVVRPWLGATGQNLTPDLMQSFNLKNPWGVLVNKIYDNGPAARAGIKPGDIIIGINKFDIADLNELNFRIATLKVDKKAIILLFRNGKKEKVIFPLEAAPERPPREVTKLIGRHPLSGAIVANMSPALAEELSLDPMESGVFVMSITSNSAAKRIGLLKGDWILGINGKKVFTVRSLISFLNKNASKWSLTLRRNGKVFTAVIGG